MSDPITPPRPAATVSPLRALTASAYTAYAQSLRKEKRYVPPFGQLSLSERQAWEQCTEAAKGGEEERSYAALGTGKPWATLPVAEQLAWGTFTLTVLEALGLPVPSTPAPRQTDSAPPVPADDAPASSDPDPGEGSEPPPSSSDEPALPVAAGPCRLGG